MCIPLFLFLCCVYDKELDRLLLNDINFSKTLPAEICCTSSLNSPALLCMLLFHAKKNQIWLNYIQFRFPSFSGSRCHYGAGFTDRGERDFPDGVCAEKASFPNEPSDSVVLSTSHVATDQQKFSPLSLFRSNLFCVAGQHSAFISYSEWVWGAKPWTRRGQPAVLV